jgi:hypothetical protein
MAIIPHPPIYLSQIRTLDIWLLLAVGALWEFTCRLLLFTTRRKPESLLRKEEKLAVLQLETNYKRKLGPSAFVETAKLERQVLALEKELEDIRARRKKTTDDLEKQLLRYGNVSLAFLIFVLYGVPIITVESIEEGLGQYSKSYLKAMLFPFSSVGAGARISKWGMPAETAANSIGALVVMWSSQVTVGKLMDAVDAYFL